MLNRGLATILLSQSSIVNAGRERGSIQMPAVFAFKGCMDATMINYNMHATIDNGSCFPATVGCLDRNAQNFNCTLPGVDDGTTAKQMMLECHAFAKGGRGITVHSDVACTVSVPPPPSPQPLLLVAQHGGRHANQNAFAALKADGSITSWGGHSSDHTNPPTDSGYKAIFTTSRALAALRKDGSISAWGSSAYGGTGAPTDAGYTAIFSTLESFAALKVDGSVTVWGDGSGGIGAPTDAGYTTISSMSHEFAALQEDGSITAWGGNTSSSGYPATPAPTDSGYKAIFSTSRDFAALRADG